MLLFVLSFVFCHLLFVFCLFLIEFIHQDIFVNLANKIPGDKIMKISFVQYNPVWENKEENQKKLFRILKEQYTDSDLLIFPEMTLTGFSMDSAQLCESIDGETVSFFKKFARIYQTDIVGGFIQEENRKFYNSLVHIDYFGELVKEYNKVHPFSLAGEHKFYSAGDSPEITKMNDWKIGLSICYDLRFPELFRMYAKERVHLIINIANWPDTRINQWRALLKARAIENQCYVIGVNRVGSDPKANYDGYSSLFDPMGEELLAVENVEGFYSVEIEIAKVEETRNRFPFLDDIKLI
jgi:predicted amidohydrolase